ncbi:MAG: hypothetical protein IJM30_02120 [Thermoguttaceae bacterium]|nr:hypothetical protein [Thermoguttaceae bacterium]
MYAETVAIPFGSALQSSDRVAIWLGGRGSRSYSPGETLSGFYSLADVRESTVESVEISVLWRTEGKGNEDVGVRAFWRLSNQDGDWIDPLRPGRFSAKLPNSPLSYEGGLIKIRWLARVRAFLANGEQLVDEAPFRLGDLPDMRALKLRVDPES